MTKGAINFMSKCVQEFLYHKFPLPGFTDNRRSSVFSFVFCLSFYSDRLDPGKGWFVLNEELYVSLFRKYKENSFFQLFPYKTKKIPFCKLNVSSGNPLDLTLPDVKYRKCDVLVA